MFIIFYFPCLKRDIRKITTKSNVRYYIFLKIYWSFILFQLNSINYRTEISTRLLFMVKLEKTLPLILSKWRRTILLAFIFLLYGFLPSFTYCFILKKVLHSNNNYNRKILTMFLIPPFSVLEECIKYIEYVCNIKEIITYSPQGNSVILKK